jgi:DNA-binding NarL/FixJ family response regulator
MIVDDHPLVVEGLSGLMARQADLKVCGAAAGAVEALQHVEVLRPDLLITDITLKNGYWIDLIKEVSSRFPAVKVLVASMHDENVNAERALRAGALGYIQKEAPCDEFLEAVRRVLDGKVYLSVPMRERLLSRALARGKTSSPCPIEGLTNRELEVFELFGQGLTKRMIASRLGLSVHTIDTYREKIKAKLDLKNSVELICRATLWVDGRG